MMLSITAGEIGAKRERCSIPLGHFSGVGKILPALQSAFGFPCVSWPVGLKGVLGMGS